MTSVIQITDENLEKIKRKTANGEKYLPCFDLEIRDEGNDLAAKIKEVIYVRKKKR